MIRHILLPTLMLLCAGCPMSREPLQGHTKESEPPMIRMCSKLLKEAEESITAAEAVDSQAARIAGFPYLRVNRFLSGFRNEVSGKAFESWVDRLQELAADGWRIELMNLPPGKRRHLEQLAGSFSAKEQSLPDALRGCGSLLRMHDLDEAAEWDALKEKATVAGEYRTWQRIAGFYPLTAMAFRLGIARWHDETRELYRIPLDNLPVTGQLVRYGPPPPKDLLNTAEIAGILKRASENPLAIPLPAPGELERLFGHFAPVFEIDEASGADRIGTPSLQAGEKAAIDTSKPAVFRHISHTRVNNRILLQLNYMIWFPARPKSSPLDLLGGHLDGLIWRVTLLPDGSPWLFDSIHHCGCYHLFFPGRHAAIKEQTELWSEPDFMPQPPFTINENERAVIRIASASHYIDRVYSAPAVSDQGTPYRWSDYDSLRSLPLPDGRRRSMFGQDGLVSGSERNERFLFWPMGIPSPGAMRQWGHHATAFVGRRHFDDPGLFERSFEIRPSKDSNDR